MLLAIEATYIHAQADSAVNLITRNPSFGTPLHPLAYSFVIPCSRMYLYQYSVVLAAFSFTKQKHLHEPWYI